MTIYRDVSYANPVPERDPVTLQPTGRWMSIACEMYYDDSSGSIVPLGPPAVSIGPPLTGTGVAPSAAGGVAPVASVPKWYTDWVASLPLSLWTPRPTRH